MSSEYKVRTGPGSEMAEHALGKALNDWFEEFGPSPIFKSCANCSHMAQVGPVFCGLYATTPPIDVVMKGCPSHNDAEEIPF